MRASLQTKQESWKLFESFSSFTVSRHFRKPTRNNWKRGWKAFTSGILFLFPTLQQENKKSIPEVKAFQHLFQLSLGGFLKCLETVTGSAKRTTSVNSQMLTKANIGAKSFAGYLDAMIFPNSTLGDDDVCFSHSHFELKSPFYRCFKLSQNSISTNSLQRPLV